MAPVAGLVGARGAAWAWIGRCGLVVQVLAGDHRLQLKARSRRDSRLNVIAHETSAPRRVAEAGEEHQVDAEPPGPPKDALLQASRSMRWSPTRRALAMAVSDGFTAPMLGKKLVSTT